MWIESHTTVGAHPKTRKLGRRLGINVPQAVGHLHLLWHWAVDYAQDGDLTRHDAEDIALGAQWDGEPDIFLEALSDAGWIDADDSGRRIHDWHDFAGKLIEAREAGARGNHKRWHVDKGVTVPSCRFCKAESGAPVGGESGATVGGESTNPPTVPTSPTSPTAGDDVVEKVRSALRAEDHGDEAIDFVCARLRDELNTNGRKITSPIAWARVTIKGWTPKRPEVECPKCGTGGHLSLINGDDGPVCRNCYEGSSAQ